MAQTTTYSAIDSAINAGNVETRRGYSSGITNPKIIEGATDFKPIAKRSYTITFTSERLNGFEQTAMVQFRIKGNVIVLDIGSKILKNGGKPSKQANTWRIIWFMIN